MNILDKLIEQGESLTNTISYVPAPTNVIRTFSVYKTTSDNYQDWLSSTQRFIKTNHPSDNEEIKEASKKLSPNNHKKILGILKAIKLLPTEPKTENMNNGSTNNINITNNQTNSQQLSVNIFLDSIKDEITGKDFKAIKEIIQDIKTEPETTKTKLLEKIKGFGGDVLSNIVANIITNPAVYNGLF